MIVRRVVPAIRPLFRPLVVRSLTLIPAARTSLLKFTYVQTARYAILPTVHESSSSDLTLTEFEKQSEHTLEYLNTSMEDLSDKFDLGAEFDVSYSSGVLSIAFGPSTGTYVLNKQTPNRQIWLSSPKSGPKRFDYDPATHSWIYRHDNSDLFKLLSDEISEIVKTPIILKNPLIDS